MKTAAEKLSNGLLLFTGRRVTFTPITKPISFIRGDAKEADFSMRETLCPSSTPVPSKSVLSIMLRPELPGGFRTLALKGAQVILISAAWPTVGGSVWDALLPARSIENQAYVIASNQTGGDYYGHSKITDFTGRVLTPWATRKGA